MRALGNFIIRHKFSIMTFLKCIITDEFIAVGKFIQQASLITSMRTTHKATNILSHQRKLLNFIVGHKSLQRNLVLTIGVRNYLDWKCAFEPMCDKIERQTSQFVSEEFHQIRNSNLEIMRRIFILNFSLNGAHSK